MDGNIEINCRYCLPGDEVVCGSVANGYNLHHTSSNGVNGLKRNKSLDNGIRELMSSTRILVMNFMTKRKGL